MTLTNIQPVARLILSLGIIFGVLAAVAATSSAVFTSDPATVNNNTFATGSADLLIASADQNTGARTSDYLDLIDGALVNGLTPGETTTFKFWLKNDSDDTMELDLNAALADIVIPDGKDFGTTFSVKFTCDVITGNTRDGQTSTNTLSTWNSSGPITLDDGHHPLSGILGASGPADSTGTDEARCTMTATLDSISTSDDSSVSFDAVFTGTQVTGT